VLVETKVVKPLNKILGSRDRKDLDNKADFLLALEQIYAICSSMDRLESMRMPRSFILVISCSK